MRYRLLGSSQLNVSEICLGTMTWGEQNTQAQAFEQINFAKNKGVNFLDTAELYPVPPKQETQGATETIIGNYFKQHKNRDEFVLASKVAAPSSGGRGEYIRPDMRLNWTNVHRALEDSLERLKTDYIDLYQVHWPDRATNFFGNLNYSHQENADETPIIETLEALGELVNSGKVRYIGISNETPWGAMRYLHLAEKHNLPRAISVQNPYNLLNRSFESGMAEIAHREQLPLLAYSPLAFGVLSGKYLGGQLPEGSRLSLYKRFNRYLKSDKALLATQAYVELAQEFGLNPAQMALAFVNNRSFIGSNIIGATTVQQLEQNIASTQISLSSELLERIEQLEMQYTYPCP